MKLLHVKANYADIQEDITHGHYMRTTFILNLFTHILDGLGLSPSLVKVRICRPRGLTSIKTQENIMPLRIKKKEILKLALARFGIIQKSIPQVNVKNLKPILYDRKMLIVVDDFSTLSMLGYEGIDMLVESGSPIVYLSHNHYNLPKKLKNLESYLMDNCSFSIVASDRDYLLYKTSYNLPTNKMVVYPNIYPLFLPPSKEDNINLATEKESIQTIVLNMGSKVKDDVCGSLIRTVNMASEMVKGLKIMIIGDRLATLARNYSWNVNVEYIPHITDRFRFILKMSTGHIGVNFSYKGVGTNIKKFDYALAGLVVLSNTQGCKGELIPYEYTFFDEADFYVKLTDLLRSDLLNFGHENRRCVLSRAQRSYQELYKTMTSIV